MGCPTPRKIARVMDERMAIGLFVEHLSLLLTRSVGRGIYFGHVGR